MRGTLMVNGKPEFVSNNNAFAEILRENLGYEAETFYRDSIMETAENYQNKCTGECDYTYRLQEHYERFLRDIQDEISSWAIKKLTKDEIADRRDKLYEMIDKEL